MRITGLRVNDLVESIVASGFPMQEDIGDFEMRVALMEDWLSGTNVETMWERDAAECSKAMERVKKLGGSGRGEGHDQFLTGITVSFNLTCSNKMWVEAERYRYFFFVSSQSTMHRLQRMNADDMLNEYVDPRIRAVLNELICEANEYPSEKTRMRMLYSCPSGLELTARITTNYRQLKTIHEQRKHHALKEWRDFCSVIRTLPYFTELTGCEI